MCLIKYEVNVFNKVTAQSEMWEAVSFLLKLDLLLWFIGLCSQNLIQSLDDLPKEKQMGQLHVGLYQPRGCDVGIN